MTIFIFVAVLLLLIIGHELGHFFAAKLSKMRVLEFGVGFPPKIFGKKFSSDGTEYTVNWLPFGGFVRIFGEDPKDADDPVAFPNKPPLAQAFVLFAGPFANVVLAFFLSWGALMIGAPAVIDSPDQANNSKDTRVLVAEVLEESPAEQAGIQAGDQIISIQTKQEVVPVLIPEDIQRGVEVAEEQVVVTVIRGGEQQKITSEIIGGLIVENPEQKAIGVATLLVGTVSYPPHRALARSLETTLSSLVFITISLGTLIVDAVTLSADVSNIAGPVGIAALTGEAATFGFGSLLSFAALLSVNLAIINLLPFPALDGGRLLFLAIETVSRRKIPTSVAGALNAAGFAILILLMVAVTIGDISRLLS